MDQQIQQFGISSPLWFAGERIALTLPADLSVSGWAVQHRIFPRDASFPGPWQANLAPYTVRPMDGFLNPRVERITLMATARSVKTEIWLNQLGYIISQDPAPVLVVMPTENKVKRICRRVTKMIKASRELRQYLTGNPDDLQKKSIVLKHLEIIFATAGSAADLGEFEARYIFEGETDNYIKNVGEQGSPTQMAEMRGRTFWNRKIVTESKPTNEEGFITKDYLRSDQEKYMVPCPWCGAWQVLDFWQLKHRGERKGEWPKDKRGPDYIKDTRAAVYECYFCQAEIEEFQKLEMLALGEWAALPAQPQAMTWVYENGIPGPEKPETPAESAHLGFWWGGVYSPFLSWSEMMAMFFEIKDDRNQFLTFVNEWLGFPFKEMVKAREAVSLVEGERSLLAVRPELEVPDNTVALTLGADNHKRGLAVSIWAWERLAPRVYNQHLIRYGWVDFQELERWIFDDVYYNREGSLVYRVWRAAVDTGGGSEHAGDTSLTEQAYEWLRSRGQGRIFGVKGSSGRHPGGNRMKGSSVDRMPGGKAIPGGLRLWMLDTHAFKDAFWSRVEAGRVFFHGATGEEFARQLTAEAREWDQKRKQWLWQQQGAQPNHFLDTVVYAAAMADPECWGGLEVLPMPQPANQSRSGREDINPFTGRQAGSFLE